MSQTSERTSGSRDFRCFTVPGIPAISAGDDLPAIITASLDAAGIELVDDDIVVVAQKIVSKAENQVVNLRDI